MAPAATATQRWVLRVFSTTTITLPADRIQMFTLERRGATATLSIQEYQQPVVHYTGRVEEAGGAITIHLKYSSGVTEPWVRCTPNTLAVAGPTAKFVMYSAMCPDLHGWEPQATSKVPVLDCKLFDKDGIQPRDYRWKSGRNLVFAPEPGIEWLYDEEECFKTDGWREIPADGSIAPPRGSYP